jgi:hypothetical protein
MTEAELKQLDRLLAVLDLLELLTDALERAVNALIVEAQGSNGQSPLDRG